MKIALLTGLVLLCVVHGAAGQNQLQNGGFEQYDEQNSQLPRHWTEGHRNYAPLAFSDQCFEGARAAEFIGDGVKRLWRQKVSHPNGHGLIIRARIKAEDAVYTGFDDKVILRAHVFYKGVGQGSATVIDLVAPPGTYDWKEIQADRVLDTKLALDYVIFSIMGQFSGGRIYIDDVQLLADESKTPAALQQGKIQDLLDHLARVGELDESVKQAKARLEAGLDALGQAPPDLAVAKDHWEQGAAAVSHAAWAAMFPHAMSDSPVEAHMIYHGLTSTREGIDRNLDLMQKAGVNGCYLSLGGWASVVYHSELIPVESDVWREFDALAYFIEEAHRRGIKVFAYLAVFHGTAQPHPIKGNLYDRHPEWFADGRERGFRIFPDPANPHVADFAVQAYTELAARYALDGIGLDYIRYPDPPALNYDENNRRQIMERYGIDIFEGEPFNDPARWAKIQEYRAEKVGEIVRRVREAVKAARPDASIIACNVSDPEVAFRGYGQNWANSAQWLDYVSPMNYEDHSADEALLTRQIEICKRHRSRFIPAIGGMPDTHGSWPISTWAERVAIQRKIGCDGIIIYRIADIDPAVASFFGKGPFYRETEFPPPLK